MRKVEYSGNVVDAAGRVLFHHVEGTLFHQPSSCHGKWLGVLRVSSTEPVDPFTGVNPLDGAQVPIRSRTIEGRTVYIVGE